MRLMLNYRNAFLRLALYHLNLTRNNAKAVEALDSMEAKIPHSVIPMDYRLLSDVANFYRYAGAKDKSDKYADEATVKLLDIIKKKPNEPLGEYNPYVVLLSIYESREEYLKAIDVLNTINAVYAGTSPGLGEQVKERIEKLRVKMGTSTATRDTVALNPQQKK
jgi:tetratricopeptide (TPR) repeat protein